MNGVARPREPDIEETATFPEFRLLLVCPGHDPLIHPDHHHEVPADRSDKWGGQPALQTVSHQKNRDVGLRAIDLAFARPAGPEPDPPREEAAQLRSALSPPARAPRRAVLDPARKLHLPVGS